MKHMPPHRRSSVPFTLRPIGVVHSTLKSRSEAPKQGSEGAPEAWIEILPRFRGALEGLLAGESVILITWLHKSDRSILRVHPRGERKNPLRGVFDTRSPDRPNPIGLHRVTIREVADNRLKVGPLDAIDGTPVLDIKPVLRRTPDS